MIPYIEIEILHTHDKQNSPEALLKVVKERFEKTHHLAAHWVDDPPHRRFRIDYPSEEYFLTCYEYGIPFFEKLHEILQDPNLSAVFPFEAIIDKTPSRTYPPSHPNYLSLRYYTNFKTPMLQNYQYNSKLAEMVQSEFFVEELEDGFLMLYRNKDDFFIQNLDRMNPEVLKNWVIKKKISPSNPSIQALLEFLEDIQKETGQE